MSSMSRTKWDELEARQAEKFDEIMQTIREALGLDADNIEREAEEAIEEWEEGPELRGSPLKPKTPLQRLLHEYHEICEELIDIHDGDAARRSWDLEPPE
jgi:hypothetical protein